MQLTGIREFLINPGKERSMLFFCITFNTQGNNERLNIRFSNHFFECINGINLI